MGYTVNVTELAEQSIRAIRDHRTQQVIYRRILTLENEPRLQGAALVGDLTEYRTVRAAGQRYRILYRNFEADLIVVVALLGIRRQRDRRDVYRLAEKLVRRGLL